MKLMAVMLGSDNPTRLGEFYTKIFGKPGMRQDDWYGFQIGECNLVIGGHSKVHGPSQTPERIIVNFETDDVKADFERIKAIGAAVVAEPYQPGQDETSGMWLATFADPDGNYFQLATPWKN